MNIMDRQSKVFFGSNERFADLINGSLYRGKQILKGCELEELDTEFNQKSKAELSQKRRDLIKRCKKDERVYAVYGAEFQSTPDKEMPLRIMEYDLVTYQKQMKTKNEIFPVSSICIYTGKGAWNYPKSLHEMMRLPEGLKGFVQNYEARIIAALSVDVNHFRNAEVREFFELFQDIHLMKKEEMFEKYAERGLKSAEAVETAAILGKCEELKKLIVKDREGNKMCENFTRMVNEWRAEGREEGREAGRMEGENKRNNEIAMTMLKDGAEMNLITKWTGISLETLVQMKRQLEVQSA